MEPAGKEEPASYTPGNLGEAQTDTGGGIIRGDSDMYEEPIGLAPAQDQFRSSQTDAGKLEVVTETTRRDEAVSGAHSEGVCSPFCPSEFPLKIKPLHFTLLVIMAIFILFTFCALCVSPKKLSQGEITDSLGFGIKVDLECGHSQVCNNGSCTKYGSSDAGKATNNAGNVFVTFGVFSFFCEILMFLIVLDWDLKFIQDKIPFNTTTIHLILTGVLWVMLTISWGTWSNQRDGACKEIALGDATNLLITVWFFAECN